MSSTYAYILLNSLVNDPKYKTVLTLVKGIRNGIVYGAKIRAPHALVMTLLFRSGAFREKIEVILRATYTHSKNLARFVFIYKLLTLLFKSIKNEVKQHHSLIAAFIGGYYVFGERNNVNEQINMYLLSRILFGLTRVAQERSILPTFKFDTFPWFAAIVWAIVLWLFEYHQSSLQPSLQSSMTYLYKDSNKWSSFKNFLIYNK